MRGSDYERLAGAAKLTPDQMQFVVGLLKRLGTLNPVMLPCHKGGCLGVLAKDLRQALRGSPQPGE
jgi:hypothetical protein